MTTDRRRRIALDSLFDLLLLSLRVVHLADGLETAGTLTPWAPLRHCAAEFPLLRCVHSPARLTQNLKISQIFPILTLDQWIHLGR